MYSLPMLVLHHSRFQTHLEIWRWPSSTQPTICSSHIWKPVDSLKNALMLLFCFPLQIPSESQPGLLDTNLLEQKGFQERWEKKKEREKREIEFVKRNIIEWNCFVFIRQCPLYWQLKSISKTIQIDTCQKHTQCKV